MNQPLTGFPPLIGPEPRLLILGSMPSIASLEANHYYAHPANAFWPIIASLNGVNCPPSYQKRKEMLWQLHLALWDVCFRCQREGSADSAIREVEPNPINDLLNQYPTINRILFNGQTAARLFYQYIRPDRTVTLHLLPSTSPANTISFQTKLEAWKPAIQPV
jgi:hypoxanthine-DNA glycosylase